jgi:hypothetical protein
MTPNTPPARGHSFKYNAEIEIMYRDNNSHPTPELRRLLTQAGIAQLRDVTHRGKRQPLPIPFYRQESVDGLYIVAAYNDHSVDFEIVIASDKATAVERSVKKLNRELRFTDSCGQHLAVKNTRDWFNERTALAVQNIALAFEAGMLRKAQVGARSSWRRWASVRPNYQSMRQNKYSAVHPKRMCGEEFVEFRLHNPVGNSYLYHVYLPKIISLLSQNDIDIISSVPDPMSRLTAQAVIFSIISEAAPNVWKYAKQSLADFGDDTAYINTWLLETSNLQSAFA